jgi:hypothetical protein
MTKIAAAVASSHAFAFFPLDDWERSRERNRANYTKRFGVEPPVHPKIADEAPEENERRFKALADGFAQVRSSIDAIAPDVMLIFGDDQHEHFREFVPQIAIYTGDRLKARFRDTTVESSCDQDLAKYLLEATVDGGFDVAEIKELPDDVIFSHAIAQIIQFYGVSAPVIPIWINGIVPPSPSPGRCYDFGQKIREALGAYAGAGSAVLYGSGGLSHFTAGFPYDALENKVDYGSIFEAVDREVVEAVREGRGRDLAKFTSKEFLEAGEIETRMWVAIMGAVNDAKPEFVEYQPFYRAIMGMGLAFWNFEN